MPHFKAIIGRIFPKIILTFTSEHFFYPCSFAKKRCNTLQGFGAFFFQSCDHCSFLLFSRLFFSRSFLIFMVTSDWILNQLRIRIALLIISNFNGSKNGTAVPCNPEAKVKIRYDKGIIWFLLLKRKYCTQTQAVSSATAIEKLNFIPNKYFASSIRDFCRGFWYTKSLLLVTVY